MSIYYWTMHKIIKLQYSKLEIPAYNKSLKPPVVIFAEDFLCVLKVFKSLITPYYRASRGVARNFWLGGTEVILSYWFAIQEKYKVWHIYIYTCLPALVLVKNLNLTKTRLHLQEIIFIEIKYNKVTINNYKINSS